MRRSFLVFAVLAVGIVATAGVAEARLDRSFGQGGVVQVEPQVPSPWRDQYIRKLAAARDGSSFALWTRECTPVAGCGDIYHLLRYGPDGVPDPTFGGARGFYELPLKGEGIPDLAVDSSGRPLLAQVNAGRMIVRRLTPTGFPDPSFGANGSAEFSCACPYGSAELIPGPRGMVTAAFSQSRFGNEGGVRESNGTETTFVRLDASGSIDRGFGRQGYASIGLRGADPYTAAATTARGGLYLSGSTCCGSALPGYVVRISRRGRIDRRFTTAARRAVRAIDRLHGFEAPIQALSLRRSGKIDLLGSVDFDGGFALRLLPSGHLDRGFGGRGLRRLAVPVTAAALASDGATIAVGDSRAGNPATVMRILPGGRLDRRFGLEPLPGSVGDSGFSVAALDRRAALVLDLGLRDCRGYCAAAPKIARYLEGRAPRNR